MPSLKSHGGEVICLMRGLIGLSPTTLVQITSYNDIHSWDGSQDLWPSLREQFVERESVRLLKPVSQRPKKMIPIEDRRPIYGYRKFIISPDDLSEFVTCSENGIWPRIESMGACILGMWTTTTSTTPMKVILLTGYHSPSHWEQTRYAPENMGASKELWDREMSYRSRRVELTKTTKVNLMTSLDIDH